MEQENTLHEPSKNKVGRPPVWDDPETFSNAVDDYFKDNKTPTWSGLALYLGFASRDSLNDYKKKDGFSDPIKKALMRIENGYEQRLYSQNVAGAIFALKNFGWNDRQEIESHTDGKMEVIVKYEKNRGQSS